MAFFVYNPETCPLSLHVDGSNAMQANINSLGAGLYNIGSEAAPFANIFLGDTLGNVFTTEWSADALKLTIKGKHDVPFLDLIIEGQTDLDLIDIGGDLILKPGAAGNIVLRTWTSTGSADVLTINGIHESIELRQRADTGLSYLKGGTQLQFGGTAGMALEIRKDGVLDYVSLQNNTPLIFYPDNTMDLGYYTSGNARPKDVYVGTSVKIASSLDLSSDGIHVIQDTGYLGQLDSTNVYRFATGNFKSGITVGCKGGETGKILLGGASRSYFDSLGTLIASNTSYLEGDASSNIFIKNSSGNFGFSFDPNLNVTVGAGNLAVSATDGFPYIPLINGVPTGTPTSKSGYVPIAFDSANDKLYVYDAGWIGIDSKPSLHLDGSNSPIADISWGNHKITNLSEIDFDANYRIVFDAAHNNIGFGYAPLNSNTTGHSLIGIGYKVLYDNTIGYENTAIGTNALRYNVSGYRNSAYGKRSLYKNTTGHDNTAAGMESLWANETGERNVAVGSTALYSNIGGDNNTAIGVEALYTCTGDKNVAVGEQALASTSTGSYNVAIGNQSLAYNVTGSHNVGIGYWAGSRNTQSNRLIIDAYDRGLEANEPTQCLIYGIFDPTPSNQQLNINTGIIRVSGNLSSRRNYESTNGSLGTHLANGEIGEPEHRFYNGHFRNAVTIGAAATGESGSLKFGWHGSGVEGDLRFVKLLAKTGLGARKNHACVYIPTHNSYLFYGGDFKMAAGDWTDYHNAGKTGILYNPARGTWKLTSVNSYETTARNFMGACFLADSVGPNHGRVFVFGGAISGTNSGFIYDVNTDGWISLSTINAPSPRFYPFTYNIATEQVLVWGGNDPLTHNYWKDGKIYHAYTDTWSDIATCPDPLNARYEYAVAFLPASGTSGRLVMWGGHNGEGTYYNTGYVYDVATDTWSEMTTTGAPSGRRSSNWFYSVGVGINDRFFVWGGYNGNPAGLGDGAIYDPATDSWSAIASPGSSRYNHASQFTGTTSNKVVIWGGCSNGYLNTGLIYDITNNSWSSMSTPDLEARGEGLTGQAYNVADQQFCITGGGTNVDTFASGGFYRINFNSWDLTTIYNIIESKCSDGNFSISRAFVHKNGNVYSLKSSLISDDKRNVFIGSHETGSGSTDGFIYIPAGIGVPGTPTSKFGYAPLYVDIINHRLYIYADGAWRYVVLT